MNIVPWRRNSGGAQLPSVWEDWLRFPAVPGFFGEFAPTTPAVDVIDGEAEVTVRAEIPGATKEDLTVELGEGYLTISGEKREEKKDERKGYVRHETRYGSFTRSVGLPAEVVADEAEATYADGVLTVTLPKTPQARKRSKTIDVK